MPEDKDISPNNQPFEEESKYYYYENGLMVFTEAYHLLRGYCCERGCRHCPYGFKKKGRANHAAS
jgi:Family of unknown function (DUF5522)